MSLRTRPPFRADHVGSFLRPPNLLDMRDRHKMGAVTTEALRAHEDASIADLVRFEERLRLGSITDGEFRRGLFHADFLNAIHNVEFKPTFRAGQTRDPRAHTVDGYRHR